MKTARTKIDVYNGTLTMEFDGEIACFKVLDEKGDHSNSRSCYAINEFDSLFQQVAMGPYKEKEVEDDNFMLNDMPNKDGTICGKNKKIKVMSQVDKFFVLFKV